ncbi:MAG: VTC domain-containing protein, partial [Acutalibacteraceae bacterium]
MAKGTIFSFERYEKKYFLTEAGAHRLLGIMDRYLKPDAYGEYTVCNIYYDTDDWRIISVSCEKPDYKEKLRVRSYGVPEAGDNVFAELKKKCSGIVYKRRIVTAADEITAFLNRTDLAGSQTENEIMWFQK